jgi:hypothetical protein
MLILEKMLKSFEFCIPTRGTLVPDCSDRIHEMTGSTELKYAGYRLGVERKGDRVPLTGRGGYDCTKRFPWIVKAALKNPMVRPSSWVLTAIPTIACLTPGSNRVPGFLFAGSCIVRQAGPNRIRVEDQR